MPSTRKEPLDLKPITSFRVLLETGITEDMAQGYIKQFNAVALEVGLTKSFWAPEGTVGGVRTLVLMDLMDLKTSLDFARAVVKQYPDWSVIRTCERADGSFQYEDFRKKLSGRWTWQRRPH